MFSAYYPSKGLATPVELGTSYLALRGFRMKYRRYLAM